MIKMESRRHHFIDWLRVLAVLLLLPFHTSRVFNADDPFYVKSDELSTPISYVLSFVDAWHMPLLFFLAGASTFFAFRKRTRREYLTERVRRLMVPLLFGVLVLVPPQTWYGGRFNSEYTGSYVHYLASRDFLVMNIRDGGDYYGGLGIGHLWFILVLLVVAVAMTPLVGPGGRRASRWQRLSNVVSQPAGWLLAGGAIFVAEGLPDVFGKNPFYYLVFFALGYAAMSSEHFMETAQQHRWPALLGGGAVVIWWVASWRFRTSLPDPSVGLAAINLLGMTGRWLVIVGLVGVARRHLDRPSRRLAYLAEASYPIYIIHQTVIVVLAYYIVQITVTWPLQWLLLLGGAVVGTFLAYEGVRRIDWLRIAFGMRPMPSPAHPKTQKAQRA